MMIVSRVVIASFSNVSAVNQSPIVRRIVARVCCFVVQSSYVTTATGPKYTALVIHRRIIVRNDAFAAPGTAMSV